ncbi:hypothetical protein CEXT_298361 [Caerostris extrusa]|uniref:Maturase K n=1 Tax=Caerostris extrusa TaxID=172846 RepID=A0AAV4M8N9_CAEEX|nr:hypothetical protein CEXT_298361 [Caerostris extrusa]
MYIIYSSWYTYGLQDLLTHICVSYPSFHRKEKKKAFRKPSTRQLVRETYTRYHNRQYLPVLVLLGHELNMRSSSEIVFRQRIFEQSKYFVLNGPQKASHFFYLLRKFISL